MHASSPWRPHLGGCSFAICVLVQLPFLDSACLLDRLCPVDTAWLFDVALNGRNASLHCTSLANSDWRIQRLRPKSMHIVYETQIVIGIEMSRVKVAAEFEVLDCGVVDCTLEI